MPSSTSVTMRRNSGRVRGRARGSRPRARKNPLADWSGCAAALLGMMLIIMSKESSPIAANHSSGGVVYVSGAFRPAAAASVSVFDHGLLYGDGIFEGIRAYNGRIFKLERHIERLFDSAKAIRLEIPHTPAEVCDIVVDTCRQNDIHDGYIRLIVTRGPGDLGINPRTCAAPELIVIARPQMTMYAAAERGIRVITSTFRRNAIDATSPSIKSL